MTRFRILLPFAGILLLLNSCFKEDTMLPKPPRGNVKTDTIGMTDNYKYQVWFRLDSGLVVSTNVKTLTDLGFECGPQGWHVILNTSDFVRVADLGTVPFGAACDSTGVHWQFDKSDGNPDSIAIGRWFSVAGTDTVSNNHVYLLDRGLDELGNPLGLYQIIFDSLKNGNYYFRYSGWKGGAVKTGKVSKEPGISYIYFNLGGEGSVQQIEPPMTDFDLLFTQYTTLLFTAQGGAYPYLVTGVLINRSGVVVATDSLTPFSELTLDVAKQFTYSSNLDAIGYLWKFYNFDNGNYTIREKIHYVIHDPRGFYYKLRFIGFYNNKGAKGYPVIEYQRL